MIATKSYLWVEEETEPSMPRFLPVNAPSQISMKQPALVAWTLLRLYSTLFVSVSLVSREVSRLGRSFLKQDESACHYLLSSLRLRSGLLLENSGNSPSVFPRMSRFNLVSSPPFFVFSWKKSTEGSLFLCRCRQSCVSSPGCSSPPPLLTPPHPKSRTQAHNIHVCWAYV